MKSREKGEEPSLKKNSSIEKWDKCRRKMRDCDKKWRAMKIQLREWETKQDSKKDASSSWREQWETWNTKVEAKKMKSTKLEMSLIMNEERVWESNKQQPNFKNSTSTLLNYLTT
jgi:hypothetical protein